MNARSSTEDDAGSSGSGLGSWALTVALTLAVLTDGINASIFGVARARIMGDLHATPDEIAWANLGYLAAKLALLPAAAWIVDRLGERRSLLAAQTLVVASSVACAMTARLEPFVAARILQGAAGAVLLVAAQTILLRLFPRARQGLVQAVYAMGILVAPNALAPLVQGWLTDACSWAWAFWLNPLIASASLLCLAFCDGSLPNTVRTRQPFDWPGFGLLTLATALLAWVLIEGPRWNWFDDATVTLMAWLGAAALAGFALWRILGRPRGRLCDGAVFADARFALAFVVSFIAGFVLAGSAFLIPAMAAQVIGMSPGPAGMLLAPAGLAMTVGLLVAGTLVQARNLEPLALVPGGILLMMAAMWMLSGSGPDSGAGDLGLPLLARGLGMGLLFLAVTMLAFGTLETGRIASGVALFSFGRQTGGIVGISFLTTFLDRRGALAQGALIDNLDPASIPFIQRQDMLEAALTSRGFDPELATDGAAAAIRHLLRTQIAALTFSEAFFALMLAFVVAAPAILAFKVVQKRVRWGAPESR